MPIKARLRDRFSLCLSLQYRKRGNIKKRAKVKTSRTFQKVVCLSIIFQLLAKKCHKPNSFVMLIFQSSPYIQIAIVSCDMKKDGELTCQVEMCVRAHRKRYCGKLWDSHINIGIELLCCCWPFIQRVWFRLADENEAIPIP